MFKVLDHVRLLGYPEQSINGYAQVVKVINEDYIEVSNLNMPYSGTLVHEKVHRSLVKKV